MIREDCRLSKNPLERINFQKGEPGDEPESRNVNVKTLNSHGCGLSFNLYRVHGCL